MIFFCFIDLLIHDKNCSVTCRYSFKKKIIRQVVYTSYEKVADGNIIC